MSSGISIGDAVRFGWKSTRAHLGLLAGVVLVVILVDAIPQVVQRLTSRDAPLISALAALVGLIVQTATSMGLIQISLRLHDGRPASLADLVAPLPLFLPYLGGSLLYGLVILVGILLLIVPGIVWMIQYAFFGYVVIDRGRGALESLKMSARLTRGVKWQLFLYGWVLLGITILGALVFGVGLLVAIPVSLLATAHVYRQLQARADVASRPITTSPTPAAQG